MFFLDETAIIRYHESTLKKGFRHLPAGFSVFTSSAQDITGTWQGVLDVQGKQTPIVFHIKKDSTNKWIAAFDSPSQQAFNLGTNILFPLIRNPIWKNWIVKYLH